MVTTSSPLGHASLASWEWPRRPTFVVDLCLGADWGFLQRQAGFGETQALPLPRAAASVRRRLGSSHSLGGEISVTGVPGVESFTTLSVVYEWGS